MNAPSPFLALAEASPIVCEPNAYALAAHLGFAGSPRLAHRITSGGLNWADALHVETVTFYGPRFKLARHQTDQRGAVTAFVFAGRNAAGEIVDAVAIDPTTDRVATLIGSIGTLGLSNLSGARLLPLTVFETVSDWLRDGRDGLFILDAELAAAELEGVTIAAKDREAGVALRERLAPHSRRPPQILIPEAGGRRYG